MELDPNPPATVPFLELRLGYRPPFDWASLLEFFRSDAVPGVETVDSQCYRRSIALDGQAGLLEVQPVPGEHQLCMRVSSNLTGSLAPIVARVRRMFDLGADPEIISEQLGQDPALRPFLAAYPGLRVPGAWDGFEMAVRAILGQQVSITAAATLAGRLAQVYGEPFGDPSNEINPVGINRLFPWPEALAYANLEAPGMPAKRWEAIRGLAAAAADRQVDFSAARGLDDLVGNLVRHPGIGPWTAHYLALRLGEPDAFPGGDLALRRAASDLDGAAYSEKTLTARSAMWRPWRSYAAMYLWRRYYPNTPPP